MTKYLKYASVILFLVFVGLLFTYGLNAINQDLGRHLKTGQIILETGHVPKTNTFSFTEPDHVFINHHWLSEVGFYLISLFSGLKSLIIFKSIVFTLIFLILFWSLPPNIKPVYFMASSLVFMPVLLSRGDVRPEIFSYLFLVIFIFAILRAKYRNEYKWLWALPIVELLWVNCHIYFPVGIGLLFLFFIDRWVSIRKLSDSVVKKIGYILGLSMVTTLINPNFIKGAIEPFTIMGNYGYSVLENQTLFFIKNYGILLQNINFFIFSLVVVFISFIVYVRKNHKLAIFESLVVIAVSILSFQMIRNFGLYALVAAPITAINLGGHKNVFNPKYEKTSYIILLVILSVFIWGVLGGQFYRDAGVSGKFGLNIQENAKDGADFVINNNISGPMFNNFDIGSYLIWRLYPKQKVFVDGRPEAYGTDFFENIYKPMQENPQTWKELSDKYNINYVFFAYTDITPWAQTFLQNISQDKNWPLIYADQSVVVFIKNTSQNQLLINKYKITTKN
ncbi:MAG: hypothetical protein M1409_11135 [Actinobacteria bacterium]|nr:hypothetical protein [Actinomycetota bacterium]